MCGFERSICSRAWSSSVVGDPEDRPAPPVDHHRPLELRHADDPQARLGGDQHLHLKLVDPGPAQVRPADRADDPGPLALGRAGAGNRPRRTVEPWRQVEVALVADAKDLDPERPGVARRRRGRTRREDQLAARGLVRALAAGVDDRLAGRELTQGVRARINALEPTRPAKLADRLPERHRLGCFQRDPPVGPGGLIRLGPGPGCPVAIAGAGQESDPRPLADRRDDLGERLVVEVELDQGRLEDSGGFDRGDERCDPRLDLQVGRRPGLAERIEGRRADPLQVRRRRFALREARGTEPSHLVGGLVARPADHQGNHRDNRGQHDEPLPRPRRSEGNPVDRSRNLGSRQPGPALSLILAIRVGWIAGRLGSLGAGEPC